MTFEHFVDEHYPTIRERYLMYMMIKNNPEGMIGLHVTATSAGMGCGAEGGTTMVIHSVDNKYFSLLPDTKRWCQAHVNCRNGWLLTAEELPFRVKLTDPELGMVMLMTLESASSQ